MLESKADMQTRGQAPPDDADALALICAQDVAPPEKEEERDEEVNSAGRAGTAGSTAQARACSEHHSKLRNQTRHRADFAARRQRLYEKHLRGRPVPGLIRWLVGSSLRSIENTCF